MKNTKVRVGVLAFALASVLVTVFQNCGGKMTARSANSMLGSQSVQYLEGFSFSPTDPNGLKVVFDGDTVLSEEEAYRRTGFDQQQKAGVVATGTEPWPGNTIYFKRNTYQFRKYILSAAGEPVLDGNGKPQIDPSYNGDLEYNRVIEILKGACTRWAAVTNISCIALRDSESPPALTRVVWVNLADEPFRHPTTGRVVTYVDTKRDGGHFNETRISYPCGDKADNWIDFSCATIGYHSSQNRPVAVDPTNPKCKVPLDLTDRENCPYELRDYSYSISINRAHFDNIRTVTHEVGHLLGLSHLHSRADRDSFIILNTQFPPGYNRASDFNISPGSALTGNGDSFDWGSIMGYRFNNLTDRNFTEFSTDRSLISTGAFAIRNEFFEEGFSQSNSAFLSGVPSPGDAKAAMELYEPNGPSVAKKAPCTFNGASIPHGTRVGAYTNGSNPNPGEYCQVEARVCTDGTLSGSSNLTTCAARCSVEGGGRQFKLGEMMEYYRSARVPAGSSCEQITVPCKRADLGIPKVGSIGCVVDAPARVDCVGSWSTCSKTCGTGVKTFTATVLAANGGRSCQAVYADPQAIPGARVGTPGPQVNCNIQACASDAVCPVTTGERASLDSGTCTMGTPTAVDRTGDPTNFKWDCRGTDPNIDHCNQKKLTCAATQTRTGAGTSASPYVCVTAGVPSCTLSYTIKNSAGVDVSASKSVPWQGRLTESIQCSSLRANSTVKLFSFKDDVEQEGTPFTITLNAAGAFTSTVTNDNPALAGSWVRYLEVSDANGQYISTEANKQQLTVEAAPTYIVKGFVEPAVYEGPVGARTKITIRGWACMRSDTVQVNTPIDVYMWLGAKSIAEGGRLFLLRTDINLTPGPDGNAIAAECNSINTAPKRFEIALTGTEFNNAKEKRVYFFGVPGPGTIGPAELTNSGFLIEGNTAGGPPACTLTYTGLNAAKHLPWNASGSENIQCSNLAGNTVMLYSEQSGNPQEGFPVTVTLSASGGFSYPFTNNIPALAGSYVRHVEFLDASSNYASTPDQTFWIDPQPSYSVKGIIDQPVYFGAVGARTGVDIGGWACRRSDSEQVNEPISVHLYFGAKPGQAGAIGPIVMTANIAVSGSDGAAINGASNCNSTDVRKRFVFSIRGADLASAKGKRVFIYGVPGTISPAELGNSGTYTVESDAAAGPPSCALSYTGLSASRHLAWGATATEKIECHNLRPGSTVELFSTKDGASEDGSPFQIDLNASGVYTRSTQNNDASRAGSYARYVRVTDALDQIYIPAPGDSVPTYPDFTFIVDPGASYTVKGVVDAVIPIAGSGGTSTGVRVQGWACLRSSTAEATAPIDVHLYFDSVGPMVATANLAVSGSDATAINSSSNCNSSSTLKRFVFEVTENTSIKYSAVRGKKVNVYAIYAPQSNPRLGGTNFWAEDGTCTLNYSNITGGTLPHGATTTESIECSSLRANSVVKLYSNIDGTTQAGTPFNVTLDANGKSSGSFTNNVDALYGKQIERYVEVSVGGVPYFTGTPITVYIQGPEPLN